MTAGADNEQPRTHQRYHINLTHVMWKLLAHLGHFALRCCFSIFLFVYHGVIKVFKTALQPFEPVIEQVRKVPPKDVSCEGILYQFLRLYFIILLYLSPFVVRVIYYILHPVVSAKDQIVDYMKQNSEETKTELNEQPVPQED